jgi:hypothetical protein
MQDGIKLISAEREEQIVVHGFTVDQDKKFNNRGELVQATRALLKPAPTLEDCPNGWLLSRWEHMISKPFKQRLIIAGSFIAAQLDIEN